MDEAKIPEESSDWIQRLYAAQDLPELADRDYIHTLDLAFDPEAQLRAIHGLLRRNKIAEDELAAEIREAEEDAQNQSGQWSDYAIDGCVDLMHHSVYQDGTHSLSAVGMLAPFIETVVKRSLSQIRETYFVDGKFPDGSDRLKRPSSKSWDCRFTLVNGKFETLSFVEGAKQISGEVGLNKYLPTDFWMVAAALFDYRNRMFHNGMEWPTGERTNFQQLRKEAGWPASWFSAATSTGASGEKPWMFYMTDEFIDRCASVADVLIESIGQLIKNELGRPPRN